VAQGGCGDVEEDDEPATGEIQDAVPPEWTRMLEREAAARRMRREYRMQARAGVVPVVVLAVFAVAAFALIMTNAASTRAKAPAVIPSRVRAFTASLPEAQRPNAVGVTVVDATDAPTTWRVAWETGNAAFCFAFVHESGPAQQMCDAPGSVNSAQMRIVGELSDTALTMPTLFACGYTTGGDWVYVDDDAVFGTVTELGDSELGAYCVQLPDGTAPGASFTVSTQIVTEIDSKDVKEVDVTATYP